MKTDIRYRDDIDFLIRHFYLKLSNDVLLKTYFSGFDAEKKERFIKGVTDFWENIILYTGDYNGNPMEVHSMLHQKQPMTELHFKHWNELFSQTLESFFDGPKVDIMKKEAQKISLIIQGKLLK